MTWMKTSDPERFELYDMNSDPFQQTDISEERTAIVDDLKMDMIDLWIEMRDEGLNRLN